MANATLRSAWLSSGASCGRTLMWATSSSLAALPVRPSTSRAKRLETTMVPQSRRGPG
jgi:hypothetical protein